MVIQKIVKFEQDAKDSYSVWYEGSGDNRACMTKVRYDLAKCIDEFLRRAIAPEDIERLIKLTRAWRAEESLDYM